MKNTKIAVIGGTGKSGKYLVKELINQGFHLKLLVRNPENFKNPNSQIDIIVGDVTNYKTILELVDGCEAVISTLGLGIPASELTVFSQSTANILKAMNERNINRYIVITGLNVDTPFDKKSQETALGTDWMKKNFPISTANKQLEYEILSESNINWTLVRLPLIELTDNESTIKVSLEDCLGNKISATDLAHFLIKQLKDTKFIKKSPFISSN